MAVIPHGCSFAINLLLASRYNASAVLWTARSPIPSWVAALHSQVPCRSMLPAPPGTLQRAACTDKRRPSAISPDKGAAVVKPPLRRDRSHREKLPARPERFVAACLATAGPPLFRFMPKGCRQSERFGGPERASDREARPMPLVSRSRRWLCRRLIWSFLSAVPWRRVPPAIRRGGTGMRRGARRTRP